ncbi:hypothetical protein Ciccas_004897 [Cichlidogyrus casuarinus]|uniref:Band 7 domain-containing protein n=1 Tax=Cichlidogyrus casuarinus TaxID=1844966 RepID=A0ABD2QA70_9PLAT
MISRQVLQTLKFAKNNGPLLKVISASYNTPVNTGILFVPERQAWVVERFGKFNRILEPGLNICIPLADKIAYVQLLKEIAIDIPDQSAITADNVVLQLNGVLFLKVDDAFKASYGVEDAEFAITQLAQTTMRSEIGKIPLDDVFKERETLNQKIVMALSKAAAPWGITCQRDIRLPDKIKEAMQMQVEAERKKRAAILESEGLRDSEINKAEGMKRGKILSSEGQKLESVNIALGEAEAIIKIAESRAHAISKIAKSIQENNGVDAVQMAVAEKYIEAFKELAQKNNTILMPANTNDPSSMIAQALTIYKKLSPTTSSPNKLVQEHSQKFEDLPEK